MAHIVVNEFIDTDKTHYKVGDKYPKGDKKPTKKRIEELSKTHKKYNRIFIEEAKVNDDSSAKK